MVLLSSRLFGRAGSKWTPAFAGVTFYGLRSAFAGVTSGCLRRDDDLAVGVRPGGVLQVQHT
jgi:hypothetical protein